MTDPTCDRCASSGWVCEGHGDRPWGGASKAPNACECGPGDPCPDCNETIDVTLEDEAEFACVEPFDIDDGQLDGLSPQLIFVLGVEWQMVAAQLDAGKPIDRYVHTANRERVQRMLIRRKRRGRVSKVETRDAAVDAEWVRLQVEGVVAR